MILAHSILEFLRKRSENLSGQHELKVFDLDGIKLRWKRAKLTMFD